MLGRDTLYWSVYRGDNIFFVGIVLCIIEAFYFHVIVKLNEDEVLNIYGG